MTDASKDSLIDAKNNRIKKLEDEKIDDVSFDFVMIFLL